MATFDPEKVKDIREELHSHLPSDPALRAKALMTVLERKGYLNPANVDAWVEAYSEDIGPKRGARIVARSWLDAGFRARLLDNAAEAIKDFEFEGTATGHLKAVANDAGTHNLVVCTLCSCYPFSVLGIAPPWYKANAYRARAVSDPRGVLAEFKVEINEDTEIRVWDSTAELRYMVIPERPAGTDGWSEEALAACVTRNSMIGTDRVLKAVS